jgi:hypothetical protein
MPRPTLEVADFFRGHGPAWRQTNAGHVSLDQIKVVSAIQNCRTAALVAMLNTASTFEDLKDHRMGCLRRIARASARSLTDRALHRIREAPSLRMPADVVKADVYVSSFAWRYGYVPKDDEHDLDQQNEGGRCSCRPYASKLTSVVNGFSPLF